VAVRLTVALIVTAAARCTTAELAPATHKQVRTIQPTLNGRNLLLKTFCLDAEGNVLACCSTDASTGMIQVYSPNGKLLETIQLEFAATAIDVDSAGNIYVAGNGKVSKLAADGRVLATSKTPNIQDTAQLKKELEQAAKEQRERMLKSYTDLVDRLETQLQQIEAVAEAERSQSQTTQLGLLKQQRTFYAEQLDRMEKTAEQVYSLDAMIASKMRVTAIAANSKDVFVSCAATKGYGYDIWRMNSDLEDATRVVSQVGGCCGQMDVQCTEAELVVAENTKFKVAFYDRDGKRLRDFGDRDRKSENGFGSCCNPMNVLCCPDGAVLTAESSIGNIKRFNSDGEMLGFVGKATIGGGCKHCALGYDAKRDYYYMMHEDKHLICVLVPLSEAPEFTEEEIASQQAMKGLGQKLMGTWKLVKDSRKATDDRYPATTLDMFTFASMDIGKDGTIHQEPTEGNQRGVQKMEWKAVKQEGNVLEVALIQDGVTNYGLLFEFVTDDDAIVKMLLSEIPLCEFRYQRER
jgi:hypothetical protein